MTEYLLTFAIGLIASIVSGMAGGGAGLITSPLFMIFGMPPHVAIATAKVGGLGITLGGFFAFRKTNFIRWSYVLFFSCIAGVASVIGSLWLLSTDAEVVEKVVGFMMLGSLPFLFLKKDVGVIQTVTSFFKKIIGSVMFFCVSVLQAGFGGGVGTMIPVILMHLFGFTALEANATRKIPGMIIAFVSLAIFMMSGIVDYKHGLAILVGTYIGSSIGTRIAIKKGERFVKGMLGVVLIGLSLKLLFF
jgi:uncharacterized protein